TIEILILTSKTLILTIEILILTSKTLILTIEIKMMIAVAQAVEAVVAVVMMTTKMMIAVAQAVEAVVCTGKPDELAIMTFARDLIDLLRK
ncbi:hypothetical protein ACSRDC_19685, partial [Acinetobacter baumannii]|uniref:hypothetical protein n=1 Tax=Acinetobacter baumannii TaxID=470 RepID=UPI003ED890F2